MDSTDANLSSFDDPGLKAAVRRAWGHERATEALRARVFALAAANRPLDSSAPTGAPAVITTIRPSVWQHPWLRYGLAAAAMVLIGFGVAYRLDDTPFGRDRFGGIGGTEVTFTSTVPPPIAQGLLDSHDRCSKYPDHNAYPDVPGDNFPAMRRRLQEHLGFPVLAGNVEEALGRSGWRFKGAAVCKVGDVNAAHLVFVRDGQAISVFSLPPSSCRHAGRTPHECEDPNPDHPTAVFVWSDGVHCVVGSSTDRSLSLDQVRAVLEHLRRSLGANGQR
jgi:hypothetical protein